MRTLPMVSPPVNELGVVYVFSDFASRHRLKIIEIRAAFPDAIVVRHDAQGEHRYRVEFEFRARNFKAHKHDARKVDWLVCWEDDWPDKPKSLKVIELRQEYGLGWSCWDHECVCGHLDGFHPETFSARSTFSDVEVPFRAKAGDLVFCNFVAYKASCKRMEVDVKAFAGVPTNGLPAMNSWLLGLGRITSIDDVRAGRRRKNVVATLKRVVAFKPIIQSSDVFDHPSVGGHDNSNSNWTTRWPEIRRRLIQLRPEISAKIARYD